MKRNYKLGDFVFRLEIEDGIAIPENFRLFESEEEAEYYYKLCIGEELPELTGQVVTRREDLIVFSREGMEARLVGQKGRQGFYGYYEELDQCHAQVWVVPAIAPLMYIDTYFNSMLALEKRLMARKGMLLHSAYMVYEGQAILFSAPSGTGKSTQADLWERFRGSKTVNGDRSLLQKVDGGWYAHGWPVCGSSEICHNESTPVRAIVMLSQAKENQVERIKAMKAFSQVYSQITINRWDTEVHNKAMNLIEELITEVPFYHLACDISREAVETLYKALF